MATDVKGYLLQMKKEHIFHGDVVHEDITFQFTSVFLHWPALLIVDWVDYVQSSIVILSHGGLMVSGGLSVGATVVLYDGSPFAPRKEALFEFLSSQKWTLNIYLLTSRVTSWGTSPKYLAEIQASGLIPSISWHNRID
jgi:acetoacetyl-CoA synthetase